MAETVETTISIEKDLAAHADRLAQQLHISQAQLLEMVVAEFLRSHQSHRPDESERNEPPHGAAHAEPLPPSDANATQTESAQRAIRQGDLYWAQPDDPGGFASEHAHPHVVIQDNIFNRSRIQTVVVCALTSNLKRASEPGNLLLDAGEANLPKQSVVVVSQLSTVHESQLGDYIGTLAPQRITQILRGMRFQQVSFFAR